MEFAVVFAALFVGHSVGDHWVQSGNQAVCKGKPGSPGRKACAAHVVSLQVTKLAFLALGWVILGLDLTPGAVALAIGVDAVSHYWADRRVTLERLAYAVGKGVFYDQGTDLVNADGETPPHIGTGRYALDQSWHHAWLFIAALLAVAF